MKNLLTLLITLLITLSSLAQQGINYKAVVKDGDGNLVIGQTIGVQFTILEGAVIKYVENHTTTMTDTNGIVILNIGQGTATTGTFGAIDWSKTTTLKTEIDIDGGLDNLADLGTTQFMAVPYALNVTGLEQITENNIIDKTGWRLIGEDEIGYYPIGEKAVDLSITNSTSNNFGAIGDYSFAAGFDTGAIGIYSVALKGTANGFSSVALGAGSSANGIFSTAMSLTTTADALASTAMGRLNVGGGDGINWIETDALFEIGNGEYVEGIPVKSNALTVLKNGTIIAPSFDISEITDDKALITKEYLETNGATGLELITEESDTPGVFNTGWRLVGADPANYGPIGDNAVDLSISPSESTTRGATGTNAAALGVFSIASGDNSFALSGVASGDNSVALRGTASGTSSVALGGSASGTYSTAMGSETYASELGSTAMGYLSVASGTYSTAMGYETFASGSASTSMGYGSTATGTYSTAMGFYADAIGGGSTAMGEFTTASGILSTAMGAETTAIGTYATSMGFYTIATAESSTAIGKYNIPDINGLFMVGNGTSTSNRNNAFFIKLDGKIGINTSNPASLFEVAHLNSSPVNGTPKAQSLSILNKDTNNSWQFHTTDYLNLYQNGVFKGSWNSTSGAYVQASDRRVKKDITALENGTLNKVMQLNPVSYLMKEQTDTKRNLGLISQEVQEIFPSITHYVEESDLLTLSYTELIPILIKALQEQQGIIETQTSENAQQNEAIQSLVQRMNTLEAANNK